MTIRMNVQHDDFGLIRVQFWEPGGWYRSAVWLTPVDAARLVELLAPILREEAAKMPVPPPPAEEPVEGIPADVVRQFLDLDQWAEERGHGSAEGAKCPHCGLVVRPAELAGDKGEMACPACRRSFRWWVMDVGGSLCWSTLAPAPKL